MTRVPASVALLAVLPACNEGEVWSIVVWLRHLPPAGSLGEPAVHAGAEAGR